MFLYSFNPIAPTFMKKALKSLFNLKYGPAEKVDRELTDALLDNYIGIAGGDIRHALNTLRLAPLPPHLINGSDSGDRRQTPTRTLQEIIEYG
jgi:DNA polymerase III delta prime subunit